MRSHDDQKQRFLYRGNAFAIGGYMTRPYSEIIETQASVVLPIVGGGAEAHVEDYQYRDLVSFKSAHSKVLGNMSVQDGQRVYNTLATAEVTDLNIAGLITADRVVARLVSEKVEGHPELPVWPVGSYIDNLQIAGCPVDLPTHEAFFQAGTIDEMIEMMNGEELGFQGDSLDLPHVSREEHTASGKQFEDHSALTTIFGKPKRLPPGCRVGHSRRRKLFPWGVHIDGFGSVYFGELFINRFARRLNMIRLDLGSPEEGEIIIVSSDGNGTTYP